MSATRKNKSRLGSYYTPPALARAVVSLAASRQGEEFHSVLEPSCGDGSFLAVLSELDATRNVRAVAMDIDPCAVETARSKYPRADVRHGDFFDFCALALPERRRFDLVVGNPPWVCYQKMNASERRKLHGVSQFLGLNGNGLSNLWLPFVAACVSLLERGGIIAFLVPCDLLWGSAAGELRAFLSKELAELTIVPFADPFPELEQSMALLLGRKGEKDPVPTNFRAIPMSSWEELPPRIDGLTKPFSTISPTTRKWTPYLLEGGERDVAETVMTGIGGRFVPFSQVADVSVGVTTGRDEFFVATAQTVRDWKLSSVATPLTTPKELNRYGLKQEKRDENDSFLLHFPDIPFNRYPRFWRELIEDAEAKGLHKNYKCSVRPRWYVLPRRPSPDAFMSSIVHEYPRLVLSDGCSVSTDALRYIRFVPHVSAAKVSASFFNSATLLTVELAGRAYGGGALQLTPGDIRELFVPNPERFELDEEYVREMDILLTARRYEDATALADRRILVEGLGLDESFCSACRDAGQTLRNRRLHRAIDIPSKISPRGRVAK